MDDVITSHPSLVLEAKTVLKAINQAGSNPEYCEQYCEPLLRASKGCLESLMASLSPNATLPPVILEVLKSLSALSSENGLLRHDNLVLSGLAGFRGSVWFPFPG